MDREGMLVEVREGLIGNQKALVVDGRQLHEFLGSKQEFTAWIKKRIEEYGFIEGEDFLIDLSKTASSQGGRPRTDYILTLDMAKELAMVERNDKGRAVRRYFLECERRAQQAGIAHRLLIGKPMNGVWAYEGHPGGAIKFVKARLGGPEGYIVAIQRTDGLLMLQGATSPGDVIAREGVRHRDSVVLVSRLIDGYSYYRRMAFGILAEKFKNSENRKLYGATLEDVKAALEPLLADSKVVVLDGDAAGRSEVNLDDRHGIQAVKNLLDRSKALREHFPGALEEDDPHISGGALAMLWGALKRDLVVKRG